MIITHTDPIGQNPMIQIYDACNTFLVHIHQFNANSPLMHIHQILLHIHPWQQTIKGQLVVNILLHICEYTLK